MGRASTWITIMRRFPSSWADCQAAGREQADGAADDMTMHSKEEQQKKNDLGNFNTGDHL